LPSAQTAPSAESPKETIRAPAAEEKKDVLRHSQLPQKTA